MDPRIHGFVGWRGWVRSWVCELRIEVARFGILVRVGEIEFAGVGVGSQKATLSLLEMSLKEIILIVSFFY